MSEYELYQELSQITGESPEFLRQQGISILGPNIIEERDEPLMIDWDQIDAQRQLEPYSA